MSGDRKRPPQWYEGYNAYHNGMGADMCPYSVVSQMYLFRDWYFGWYDAREGVRIQRTDGESDLQSSPDPLVHEGWVPALGYNDPFNGRRLSGAQIYSNMSERIHFEINSGEKSYDLRD